MSPNMLLNIKKRSDNPLSKLKKGVNTIIIAQTIGSTFSLKRKIAQVCWKIAKETAKVHLNTAKITFYENTFFNLMSYSGKKTIEEVVQMFEDTEEQNFMLQSELNEIDFEIEDINTDLKKLRKYYNNMYYLKAQALKMRKL